MYLAWDVSVIGGAKKKVGNSTFKNFWMFVGKFLVILKYKIICYVKEKNFCILTISILCVIYIYIFEILYSCIFYRLNTATTQVILKILVIRVTFGLILSIRKIILN